MLVHRQHPRRLVRRYSRHLRPILQDSWYIALLHNNLEYEFDTAGGGNNQTLLYHCCVQPLYLPQGACSAAGRRRQIAQQAAGSVSAALLNPAGCLRSAPVPQAAAPEPTRSTHSGAPALAGAHGQPAARPAGAALSQALQAHAADSPLRSIARRQLRAAGDGAAPASPAYLGSALQAVVIVAILCACGLPAVRRWSRRSWCALLSVLGTAAAPVC